MQQRQLGALQGAGSVARAVDHGAMRYLSSQFVAGSSLAQDETQGAGGTLGYDDAEGPSQFTQEGRRDSGGGGSLPSTLSEGNWAESQLPVSPGELEQVLEVHAETHMELDPMNSNPCMECVVRAVRKRVTLSVEGPSFPTRVPLGTLLYGEKWY